MKRRPCAATLRSIYNEESMLSAELVRRLANREYARYSWKNVGYDRKAVGCVILLEFKCEINLVCVIIDWFWLSCDRNARI